MAQAREKLISVSETPYLYILTRCVRRTIIYGCKTDSRQGDQII